MGEANDYFKFRIPLNGPITAQDLNLNIWHLNDIIYNYFFDNCGTVEINDQKLVYKKHTVKDFKKVKRTKNSRFRCIRNNITFYARSFVTTTTINKTISKKNPSTMINSSKEISGVRLNF